MTRGGVDVDAIPLRGGDGAIDVDVIPLYGGAARSAGVVAFDLRREAAGVLTLTL